MELGCVAPYVPTGKTVVTSSTLFQEGMLLVAVSLLLTSCRGREYPCFLYHGSWRSLLAVRYFVGLLSFVGDCYSSFAHMKKRRIWMHEREGRRWHLNPRSRGLRARQTYNGATASYANQISPVKAVIKPPPSDCTTAATGADLLIQ